MKCTRVFHDSDGETHFEEIANDELEDGTGTILGKIFPKSVFFHTESGKADPVWHNAPQRLYVVLLIGKVAVEVSDGDKREFEVGDVLLMEDTSGKGHLSSSPNGMGRTSLIICLEE